MGLRIEPAGSSWARCTDDVFEGILKCLPPSSAATVNLACREWHRQVRELQQRLEIEGLPSDSALSGFCHLRALEVRLTQAAAEAAVSGDGTSLAQLHSLRHLQSLTLAAIGDQPHRVARPIDFLKAVVFLPRLEELQLHGWTFREGDSVSLQQLRRLTLADCRFQLRPAAGSPVATANPTSPGISLAQIFGVHPKQLQLLHMTCCVASSTGNPILLAKLSAFTRLTSLSLAGSEFVSDAVAADAAQLPALEHLDLRTPRACKRRLGVWPRLTNGAAITLGGGAFRSSLRSLVLAGQADIGDSGAVALAQLTALTRLDVWLPQTGWDVGLGDCGAEAFGGGLTGLRALRMGECCLGEPGCAALGRLTQLTELELSNGVRVSDAALYGLLGLTGLRCLSLSGCVAVTDIGLCALGSKLTGLRELNISCCHENVTDMGLEGIAHGLKNLKALNVGCCHRLTDKTAKLLGRSMQSLETLDVRDCCISDAGLRALAKGLTQLRCLNLEHCVKVTNDGVSFLASVARQLSMLRLFGTGASPGIQSKFARPPAQTVLLDKDAWWLRTRV